MRETVKDILIKWLKDNGYDGLCNESCGCKLDDLAPCGSDPMYCVPGKKSDCPNCPQSRKEDCEARLDRDGREIICAR